MIETQAPLHPPKHAAEPEAKAETSQREHKRRLVLGVLPFVATAIICPSLTVWVVRMMEGPEQAKVQQTLTEREQAQKDEALAEAQRGHAVEARQTATEQRNQARATERASRRSAQESEAVLSFVQNQVLAPDQQKPWGGAGKDVTLRQVVDAAEPKVAEIFAKRPRVEASIRMVLGSTYLELSQANKAVMQFERALTLREGEIGPDARATGESRNNLARAFRNAGRPDDASRLFDKNLLSPGYAAALSVKASALLAEKKPFQAELKLRECLSIRRRIQPDDWTTFDAQMMLGGALLDQKKYAEAEPLLLSGYDGMKQREAKIPLSSKKARLTKALERLVNLYESWSKPDQAAKWRNELQTAESPKKL